MIDWPQKAVSQTHERVQKPVEAPGADDNDHDPDHRLPPSDPRQVADDPPERLQAENCACEQGNNNEHHAACHAPRMKTNGSAVRNSAVRRNRGGVAVAEVRVRCFVESSPRPEVVHAYQSQLKPRPETSDVGEGPTMEFPHCGR